VNNEFKTFKKSGHGLIRGTIPVFTYKERRKSFKFSVRNIHVPTGILTAPSPEHKSEVFPLDKLDSSSQGGWMGRECGIHGSEEEYIVFLWKAKRKETSGKT
jgi:hypothetical protein